MKNRSFQNILFIVMTSFLIIGCNTNKKNVTIPSAWVINAQQDWVDNVEKQTNLEIIKGKVVPTATEANFKSTVQTFSEKQSVKSITFSQSQDWLNWKPVNRIVPTNLKDAPVALQWPCI